MSPADCLPFSIPFASPWSLLCPDRGRVYHHHHRSAVITEGRPQPLMAPPTMSFPPPHDCAMEKKPSYEPPPKKMSSQATQNKGPLQNSQTKLVALFQTFSKDQKTAIHDVGFGGLLTVQKMDICRAMCISLAKSFDMESEEFVIQGTRLKIEIKDVEHIIGLPSQGDKIQQVQNKYDKPMFHRYKGGDTQIMITKLKECLTTDKTCNEDFIRRTLLYIIGVFVCPTVKQYVDSGYLQLLEDIGGIKSLNWCSLTLDHLIHSIKKYKRGGSVNLEGNLLLLQVWYWEKVTMYHLDATLPRTGSQKPIIQYWNHTCAVQRKAVERLFTFGTGKVVEDITKPQVFADPCTNGLPKESTKPFNNNQSHPSFEQELLDLVKLNERRSVQQDKKIDATLDCVMKMTQWMERMQEAWYSFQKEKNIARNRRKRGNIKGNKNIASDANKDDDTFEASKKKASTANENVDSFVSNSQPFSIHDGKDTTPQMVQPASTEKTKDSYNHKPMRSPSKRRSKPIHDRNDEYQYYPIIHKKTKHQETTPLQGFTLTKEDEPTIQYINSAPNSKKLVHIADIILTKEQLERYRNPDEWLSDQIIKAYISCLRSDESVNNKPGANAFLEDPVFTKAIKTTGEQVSEHGENEETRIYPWVLDRVEHCYLVHDMVFLPINKDNTHWYLAIINTKQREIYVLDSFGPPSRRGRPELRHILIGLETYLYKVPQGIRSICTKWKDVNVSSWQVEEKVKNRMQSDGSSCGLYMLKFMECWTGDKLSPCFTQGDIRLFRQKLPVVVVDSNLNKIPGGPKSSQPVVQGYDNEDAIVLD